jgi:hypothetical protein
MSHLSRDAENMSLNLTNDPLTSQSGKVTGEMKKISVDSIDYRILCNDTSLIQSWNDSITEIFPRNCVSVNGTRIGVTALWGATFATVVKTLPIPYSLQAISDCRATQSTDLEYLVFEFGSELQAIADSRFARSKLASLFLPCSLRFIGPGCFEGC